MSKPNIIEIENVTKDYISEDVVTKVLHNIDLVVKKGEFIAIVGPSGSGKSTLLNILGLLDIPTTGTYTLNGKEVSRLSEDELSRLRNREIGFVFQQFNLLKRISVLENVVLPAIYSGMKKTEREVRARELLARVGLVGQEGKRPNQLSGGQQQRVAIARALMNKPALILADEPTGNLDTKSGDEVMRIMKELHAAGNTILMITHETDIARQAERTVRIKDGVIS